MTQVTSVLVLCTGNSARSILGEALFAHLGQGQLTAYSAGSKPKGVPHPGALRLLARKGIDPAQFRSKSWNEYSGPDRSGDHGLRQCCGRGLPGLPRRAAARALGLAGSG
jgi:hypothetical protein